MKIRLKPNDSLQKVTKNMNIQPSKDYGVPPNEAEKKSIESEEERFNYEFNRIKKCKNPQQDIGDMT